MATSSSRPSNQEAEASTSAVAGENSAASVALKHNPGLSIEWSNEEQEILDEALNKYSCITPPHLYAIIALQLPKKLARDVALRCKWMIEISKRRKEVHNLRKGKDKKEWVTDPSAKPSSHLRRRSPYLPMPPLDNDEEISYKDIPWGLLLETNDKVLKKVYANLNSLQVQENIQPLYDAWSNLSKIVADMQPAMINKISLFPVNINIDLTNSILPRTK